MPDYRFPRMLAKCSLLCVIGLLGIQVQAAECPPIARLIALEGQVEAKKADQDNWEAARLDQAYCAGDVVRTREESRAALRLANQTLLRLNANSALTLTDVQSSAPTLLELIRGAIHAISRTPKRMQVDTPYVNASIEGTEFVVSIGERGTDITVLEGVVVTRNDQGSLTLGADQGSRTQSGQAPLSLNIARPYDAVAWALYYPPLPEQPGRADALAKAAIGALVQNRPDEAADLAQRAIQSDPQSAAAYMARSYVQQARFDIPAALQDMQLAVERAPASALVNARLAEVHLMSGDSTEARRIAEQAVALQPGLSLAYSVLGFASLRNIDLQQARDSFRTALELDTEAPLPHLGQGLVKIRSGELALGREDLETALLLDPANALLRSYLGKAYYEEKRDPLAYDQFGMARQLDPNDPTPWFYESILLQADNRPVEALQAQQQAIALNDNRGVYRSRQLLDQDEAARHAALGRIYTDLGSEQLARLQATQALEQDPGNHSAHRLLADTYLGITNRDSARQSELLQAKLSQPLSLDPLQPQLSIANLGLLDAAGPEALAYQEYNPLFTRNGLALQLGATLGEHNTWSDDAIVAGLHDRFAFSLGQHHSETELADNPYDYEQDLLSGFVQVAITEGTSVQLEVSQEEEDKGDVTQRLIPEFTRIDGYRVENELSTTRLGVNQQVTRDSRLLFSAMRRSQDIVSTDLSFPGVMSQIDMEKTIDLYEAQLQGSSRQLAWLGGISHQSQDLGSRLTLNYFDLPFCPLPSCTIDTDYDESQTRVYGYAYYTMNPLLSITGGLTLLKEENDVDDRLSRAYPKLGLLLSPHAQGKIHLAAFRNRTSVLWSSQYETLEPSQIVGFNQLYDDIDQTDSWNYGIAYTYGLSNSLTTGVSALYRDLSTKIEVLDTSSPFPLSQVQSLDYDDRVANLWLNWTVSTRWALNLEYQYNRYDLQKGLQNSGNLILAPDGILELTTHKLPTSLRYFHPSGMIASLTATYYDQDGQFTDRSGMAIQEGDDQGVITDIALGYRFPKRRGSATIGVNNLFDQDVRYEDRSSYDTDDPVTTASPPAFSEERTIYGKVSLTFR
ncbi:MAG: FecR domain-containing protein [Candidatus Thiodiazotropha sp.]